MKIYFYRPGDDQFWIGCSTEEAERFFLPKMDKGDILFYLEQLRQNKNESDRDGLFFNMYDINTMDNMPDAFFNVSRDLSVCFTEGPIFPVGSLWNGYSPFWECDHVFINDPEELKDIVMTLDGKPFSQINWKGDDGDDVK